MPALDATLIIPQHTRADLTLACVDSIRRTDPLPWPIVVVDDGSPDGSAEQILERPRSFAAASLTLLRQPRIGLTAAWNRAAESAASPLLVFLNNDVLADGPFLERLLRPLTDRTALMTGVRRRRETALPPHLLARLPTREFLEGWCFALRRDDFAALGRFDESLHLYWSDTDLQCRLIAAHPQHETPLLAVPHLPLRHLGHRTTRSVPERHAQWRSDRAAFVRKLEKVAVGAQRPQCLRPPVSSPD